MNALRYLSLTLLALLLAACGQTPAPDAVLRTAAVVEIISQPETAGDTGTSVLGGVGQTFTPTSSGFVTKITFYGATSGSGKLNFYAYNGSTFFFQGDQAINWVIGENVVFINNPETISAVTAGSSYAFFINGEDATTNVRLQDTGDLYAGGALWIGGQFNGGQWPPTSPFDGGLDTKFEIVIEDGFDSDGDGVNDDEDAFPNDPTRAVSCSAGSYGAFECVPAAPGYFVPVDNALEQTACPVGTFQDEAGQTSCKPAPQGTFVNTTAATEATPCSPGSYQDQLGQTACIPAPLNFYVDVEGAVAATACSFGFITEGVGSTSVAYCVLPETSVAIDNLVQIVVDLDLRKNTEKSFISLSTQAKKSYNTGDTAGASDKLMSFVSMVKAQSGKKIDAADADNLTSYAQLILDAL